MLISYNKPWKLFAYKETNWLKSMDLFILNFNGLIDTKESKSISVKSLHKFHLTSKFNVGKSIVGSLRSSI